MATINDEGEIDALLTPTTCTQNNNKQKREFLSAYSPDAVPNCTDSISKALEISMRKKHDRIAEILEQYQNNLDAHLDQLRALARSTGGLLEDEYREKIWPVLSKNIPQATGYTMDGTSSSICCLLDGFENATPKNEQQEAAHQLQISDSDFESALSTFSSQTSDNDLFDEDEEMEDHESATVPEYSLDQLRAHKEWNQVELDVARTLARFPPNIDDGERATLQKELTQLIVRILCENAQFHYYQGFHDVCLTFLLVLDADSALNAVRHLCHRGAFYNYLSCTLEESVLQELQYLYVLLFMHDQEVEKRLRNAELGTLFALSWPLTWFSHALPSYSQVVLFFDLFLCSHPLMPVYVSAALVSERRDEVLRCDHDMPSLHHLLNHIPAEIHCHRVINTALSLMERYPPGVLSEFRKEYLKICERHRRLIAVEQLQKRMEMDIAIRNKRRRSSTTFLQRDNIYALAGAGVCVAGAILSAAVFHYCR